MPQGMPTKNKALKQRNRVSDAAPSALKIFLLTLPGALPQAVSFRAFGASRYKFFYGQS
jgi:hypothetical protein